MTPSAYDLLKEIQDSVNRLEDKMDNKFDKYELSLTNRISAVEVRTQTLESWADNWKGKIAIITLFISFAFSIVSLFIKDVFAKGLK